MKNECNFAERVKELRVRMGRFQTVLARKFAVTPQVVGLWGSGGAIPHVEASARLALMKSLVA